MKRSLVYFLILSIFLTSVAIIQADRENTDKKVDAKTDKKNSSATDNKTKNIKPTVEQPVRQPIVINLNNSSSGGHNRNFPIQQQRQPSQQPKQQQTGQKQEPQRNQKPTYGQLHWTTENQIQPQEHVNPQHEIGSTTQPNNQRPKVQDFSSPGFKAANVMHHHPYTQGYVRKKLQKIGVTIEPGYIVDRGEIIHTDRQHSMVRFPQTGPDGETLSVTSISSRHFNDQVVKDNMTRLNSEEWISKVQDLNQTENVVNRYYWHKDSGFNYCHYIDSNGYQCYGWYAGGQYFWNRYYAGRWWIYDSDDDRWCFWNNGFWWWQDPYHLGDLYCYNNDVYIPCNSAEDQVVVTAPDNASMQSYSSPDGGRIVKIDNQSQDAFLYDTANPPSFDPVYLASGVKSVQFSDTSNGRPLEIILTLNDGSFDMFDSQGHPYNPGTFGEETADPNSSQILQNGQ